MSLRVVLCAVWLYFFFSVTYSIRRKRSRAGAATPNDDPCTDQRPRSRNGLTDAPVELMEVGTGSESKAWVRDDGQMVLQGKQLLEVSLVCQ